MYKNVIGLSLLLVLLFNINRISVLAEGLFNVKGKREKALYGCSFLNITETRMERCLAKCLENCRCMSFQMCEQEGCQLCSSDKEQSPPAFRERKGCTYYAFQRRSGVENQHCKKTCSAEINCCMTSNPCMNNGICEPASPTDTTTRFKCQCPADYTGNLCQHPIGKSCNAYNKGNRLAGKYKVMDNNKKPFDVYCDFNSTSDMAWTLVQSYQLQNKDKFKNPFLLDKPVNQDSPGWDSYRLSKSRMESIQKDTIKWRMTCQYNSDGVVYTDYVRGTNDKINILTHNSKKDCTAVEYINVRGHTCENCNTRIIQKYDDDVTMALHVSVYSHHHGSSFPKEVCTFKPAVSKICKTAGYEDNFGFYHCVNSAHRCSANPTSTTQTWFGGYLS